jgi:hypothetical protein
MWFALLTGALTLGRQPEPPEPEPLTVPLFVPPPSAAAATPQPASVKPPDRWFAMQSLQGSWAGALLDDNRMSVSGWTDMTFTASSDRRDQLPMGFNFRANEFLVQQNWLRIERTVDPTATTPTWGFRSDTILPGTDYRFLVARGLFDSQLTANQGLPNLYGIDPNQFYGELYLPQVGKGLDIKFGRFFVLFGAESNDSTQNPFISRSYAFVWDPFTHTGIVTTLKLNDAWSVQNGLVTGSDMFVGPEANPAYIGSVKWAPPDGRASALLSVIVGNGRFDQEHNFHNPEIFDVVLTRKLSDRLTWTFDGLYGFTTNVPGTGFANWLGAVNYLSYALDPKLTANARLEFFDDFQGQRTGFTGLYTAATAGVTYKPTPYLWLRPEVRYDHNSESRPFEGKPSVFTATTNVVVRW